MFFSIFLGLNRFFFFSTWSYLVLLGSYGLYWVALGFMGLLGFHIYQLWITGFYLVLLGTTGFSGIVLSFTGLHWVALGFTRFYWVLRLIKLVLLGFYFDLLRFTSTYWVLLSFPRFYLVLLDFYCSPTECIGFWLGFTMFHCIFLGFPWLCMRGWSLDRLWKVLLDSYLPSSCIEFEPTWVLWTGSYWVYVPSFGRCLNGTLAGPHWFNTWFGHAQ